MSVTPSSPSNRSRARGLASLAAGAVLLAACGSDDVADEPDTTIELTRPDDGAAVDLDAIRDELDALEYESETVDGVAVLGNQPLAEAAGDAAGTTPRIDPDGGEVGGEVGDSVEPCPEEGPCDDEPPIDQEPPPTPPPFVPDAAWAPFCTVLAELEDRPFPTDDLEALRTIDVWFGLLQPHVPQVVRADFAVLDRALDRAVEAQDVGLLDDVDDEALDRAADRIGDGIDAGCSGRGELDDLEQRDEPVAPPPDDVDVVAIVIEEGPDGPIVPVVEFASEPQEQARPLFGSGGEPADGHVVRGADQAFCASVAVINDRPRPSDDVEQLAVAVAYVDALLPITPDEIAPSLGEVADAGRRAVAAGGTSLETSGEADGDPGPDVALRLVDDFVDEHCLGR